MDRLGTTTQDATVVMAEFRGSFVDRQGVPLRGPSLDVPLHDAARGPFPVECRVPAGRSEGVTHARKCAGSAITLRGR
jgi:hypothetical protein